MTNSGMHLLGREKGFTLLEALVAFVVLAGGLLAAYRFNSTAITSTADAKVRGEAIVLAELKLEELRNFSDFGDFETIVQDGSGLDGYASGVYNAAVFTREWDWDEAFGNNPRKVGVTVSWPDKKGVTQTVMLSSIIWGNGPKGAGNKLAAALNSSGDPGEGWGNSLGYPPSTNVGGEIEITNRDYTSSALDVAGERPDDGGPYTYYDAHFYGDILFTDDGLASVGISGARDYGSLIDPSETYCSVGVSLPITGNEGEVIYADVNGDPVYTDAVGNDVLNQDADGNDVAKASPLVQAFTEVSPLLYECFIVGIPTGTQWVGTLTFNPAGNDDVCEPSNSQLPVTITDPLADEALELTVVVMTNAGACQTY